MSGQLERLPVVAESRSLTAQAADVGEIKAQIQLIHSVMRDVMQKDQHYGVIPGTGKKPSLLKPGAEKLIATFRLVPQILECEPDLRADGHYHVKCHIRLFAAAGNALADGIGYGSTGEDKYAWRACYRRDEWDATPENKRRLKYFKDGPAQQIATNPADHINTVVKMAKKRALVDAVLTATAASDMFTQDVEDMDHSPPPPREPAAQPVKRAAPRAAPAASDLPAPPPGMRWMTAKYPTDVDHSACGDAWDEGATILYGNGKAWCEACGKSHCLDAMKQPAEDVE